MAHQRRSVTKETVSYLPTREAMTIETTSKNNSTRKRINQGIMTKKQLKLQRQYPFLKIAINGNIAGLQKIAR